MSPRPVVFGLLGVLFAQTCHAQAVQLDLFTPEAPPYQAGSTGRPDFAEASGDAVETIQCAASRAGWSARIRVAPPNRAVYSLQRNLIDGYFPVAPSSSLDTIAARTDPVALAKWFFFSVDESFDPDKARLGVVRGSQEAAWLQAQGYDIFLSVVSASQLNALLRVGRIDAALMDIRDMAESSMESERPADFLHAHFVRFAPLYLYLGREFTKKHPNAFSQLNRFLPACMKTALTLTSDEDRFLRGIAEGLFKELEAIVSLERALEDGPRQPTIADTLNLDEHWKALAPEMPVDLAKQILSLPASEMLRTWQMSHPGLITEAMIINEMGTLSAISQLTSDYWQGDEPKFQEAFKQEPSNRFSATSLFVSPIRFDASTKQFQVTVSAPFAPVSGSGDRGVISIGLNVSEALQGMQR